MATESNKSTRPGDAAFKPKSINVPENVGYKNQIPVTTSGNGIKIRGTGAATKGTKANGPMA
jgi:hypothetical protein